MKNIRILPVLIFTLLVLILPAAACFRQSTLEAPTIINRQNSLVLYGVDPLTLDPAVSAEMTSHEYVVQIFGGLVKLEDELDPEPDIAESWDVTEGGRTYTFYLRKGVLFHSGKEVKAQDFKYSWERACRPETGSGTAATYLGDIVGVSSVLSGKNREISGIRVIDDYTLQVTTDAPKSYFLYKLGYPTAFVVNKDNVETGKDWWHQPDGTGPYQLRQWDVNNLLVLQTNSRFYGEQGKVELIVFRLWSGRPMDMYETGDIDVTGVSLAYIDRVMDRKGVLYRELGEFPEHTIQYLAFNCSKPPFDDVNVRRAFNHAIDKDKILALLLRNMTIRAEGILPPGIPGFDSSLQGLDFDVDRAKELLKASRYGSAANLPPITVTTEGWGGNISAELEAVIFQWRQNLGVDVQVKQVEPARYFYNMKDDIENIYNAGWVADYPHPQDFLDILFHTGADNNYGMYSNPEADELLDRAGVEQDRDTSLELYRRAEKIIVDDAACIPLWFGRNYLLIKPFVKGYRLNALGLPMLNKVSLELEK